jgi:uncharacterized protein
VPFELGDPVHIAMTKWGDLPHWHIPARWLGSDAHGDWLGIPAGTLMARPGLETVSEFDQVGLIPAAGSRDVERGWMATFHKPPAPTWVYVDMTSPPVWDGSAVRAVDLDLDVIRMREGWVVVDDEDEFTVHQVDLGYPPEIIALAEASRDRVHAAILDEDAPFDGTHERWQVALDALSARR